PEQPGPRRGPAPLGTDHLWGQWGGVPKLGTVSVVHEIPKRTYRGADPPYVFRTSHGPFPLFQKGPQGGGHQWNGDSQPLQTRGLGTIQCPWGKPIRPDDRRILYVHRSTGNRSWHGHHGDERLSKGAGKGRIPQGKDLSYRRPGGHERGTAQGGQHRFLHHRLCGGKSRGRQKKTRP